VGIDLPCLKAGRIRVVRLKKARHRRIDWRSNEGCYASAPNLDGVVEASTQKTLHGRCGVHPHVDDDAFGALSGAN
jgi:hypothetical protein